MVKQSSENKLDKFQKKFQKLTDYPFKKGYYDAIEFAYHTMSVNYPSRVLNNNITVYYNEDAKAAVVKGIIFHPKKTQDRYVPDVKYDPCGYTRSLSSVRGAIIQFFNIEQFRDFTLAVEVDTLDHATGLFIRHQDDGYDFIYFNPNFNETFGIIDKVYTAFSTGRKSMFGYHSECWSASGICGTLVWRDFYRLMYGLYDPFTRKNLFPYSTTLKKCVYSPEYAEWAQNCVNAALEEQEKLVETRAKRKKEIADQRMAKRAKKDETCKVFRQLRDNAMDSPELIASDRAKRALLREQDSLNKFTKEIRINLRRLTNREIRAIQLEIKKK